MITTNGDSVEEGHVIYRFKNIISIAINNEIHTYSQTIVYF